MKKFFAKLLRRSRPGGTAKNRSSDAKIVVKDAFWQARTDGDSDARTLERLLAKFIESAAVTDDSDKADQLDRARTLYIDLRSDKLKDLHEMVRQGYFLESFDDVLQSAVSIVPDDGSDEFFEYFYAVSLLRDNWSEESGAEKTRRRFLKPGTDMLDVDRFREYVDEYVKKHRKVAKERARRDYKTYRLL